MTISNLSGCSTEYPNDSIQTVSFPKAKEVFSLDECAGNDVSPDATIIFICFKDGSTATFEACNWYITEL